MPRCPRCGHDTAEPDARFCASCGQPLETDAGALDALGGAEATGSLAALVETLAGGSTEPEVEPADPVVERLQPGSALLVVRSGPAAGARFLLDADVTTAGRHPDSDIFLDDITVSRRHARFRREGHQFTVEDAGSLNGTYVNRQRIESMALHNRDEVQIGKYRLAFLTAGGDE
jgi:hypothetical protein